ncbi:MAG: hypothetical protein ACKPKO_44490, partial [Candidatus Fonsibacter sp.]
SSSWAYRRHSPDLKIVAEFQRFYPCFFWVGWARDLRSRLIENPEDVVNNLFPEQWPIGLKLVGSNVFMYIASLQRRHAWNRARTTPSTTWRHFNSNYINHEAKLQHAARRFAHRASAGSGSGAGAAAALQQSSNQPLSNQRRIGQSPLQVYRDEWLAQSGALVPR